MAESSHIYRQSLFQNCPLITVQTAIGFFLEPLDGRYKQKNSSGVATCIQL